MTMYCMSVSHKKAPVTIREKFAFSDAEKLEFLTQLMKEDEISGCVLLCTCNRSEIYISGGKSAIRILQKKIAEYKKIPWEDLLHYLNIYAGDNAIGHLFKVCCGFDSMLLGEDEILGQVKEAYQLALDKKTAGYEMHVLFQRAIACAKRIKTDTNISRTPVSIATLVANEVFHFEKEGIKNVLVIGMTGKMGSTITKNILSKAEIEVIGTVRSHRADFLVEIKQSERVKIVDYADRYRWMESADIVISATTGPHYTITYDKLKPQLKDTRKRLYMDVAVPIDMDSEISKIEGLTLYDIDFFEELSVANNRMKQQELETARIMMEEELDAAIKEVAFHPYIAKLEKLKQPFLDKPFETLLFQIRDHVTSEELKIILKTLDRLPEWVREG